MKAGVYCPTHGKLMEDKPDLAFHNYHCPEGCIWREHEEMKALVDVTPEDEEPAKLHQCPLVDPGVPRGG